MEAVEAVEVVVVVAQALRIEAMPLKLRELLVHATSVVKKVFFPFFLQ